MNEMTGAEQLITFFCFLVSAILAFHFESEAKRAKQALLEIYWVNQDSREINSLCLEGLGK